MNGVSNKSGLPSDLVAAWREEHADPEDEQRAYLRFTWRNRQQRVPARVGAWLLAGAALGIAVSSAASGIARHWFPPSASAPSSRVLPPNSAPEKRVKPGVSRTQKATPTVPGVEFSPAPGATGRFAPVDEAPGAAEIVPAPTPPAHANPRPARRVEAARLAPPTSHAAPAPVVTVAPSAWESVAADLRSGHLGRADETLEQIRTLGPVDEREAAELARAQIAIARGRSLEARRLLEALLAGARSEGIRERARKLLEAERSKSIDPATQ